MINKKSICIILFYFILPSIIKAQELNYISNYYPFIYKAEMKYMDKDYTEAFLLYKKAFENEEPLRPHLMWAITSSIKSKHFNETFEWLEKASLKGSTLKYISKLKGINKIKNDKRWNLYLSSFNSLRESWKKTLNDSIITEIKKMSLGDQLYREGSKKNERDKVVRYDTVQIEGMEKQAIPRKGFYLQREIDTKNIKRVIEIIHKYGFIEEKIIGPYFEKKKYDDPWTDIGLIIIHGLWIKDTKDTLINLLKLEVKKGNCFPFLLGYSIDYAESSRSPFQIYGTGNILKFSIPPFQVSPVRNPKELNERRISIGLEPIENYFRKNKLIKNKITSNY